MWDAVTHTCHNFNGSLAKSPLDGLAKPPLKLGHRWVLYPIVYLVIHVIIPKMIQQIYFSKKRGDTDLFRDKFLLARLTIGQHCSSNGLAPNVGQALVWTNVEQV